MSAEHYWLRAYPSGHLHLCRLSGGGYWLPACDRVYDMMIRTFPPDTKKCTRCSSIYKRFGHP